MSGGSSRYRATVAWRQQPFDGDDMADGRFATPGYFKAIGVRLQRGRLFTEMDGRDGARVVILNQEAARRYFGDRDPLGAVVAMGPGDSTVVGIVGNVRLAGPEGIVRPEAYWPFAQSSSGSAEIVVRAAGDPATVAAVLSSISPLLLDGKPPIVKTLDQSFARLTAERRFNTWLMALIGALALVITTIGVYGVTTAVTLQRTSEIGVRMVLGAAPARIVGMVMQEAAWLVGAGAAAGVLLAWILSKFVAAALFQVAPHDGFVYAVAIALIIVVGLTAALAPAVRASRLDPLAALRV